MNKTETRHPHSIGLDGLPDDAILDIFVEGQERAVAAVENARDTLAAAAAASLRGSAVTDASSMSAPARPA